MIQMVSTWKKVSATLESIVASRNGLTTRPAVKLPELSEVVSAVSEPELSAGEEQREYSTIVRVYNYIRQLQA